MLEQSAVSRLNRTVITFNEAIHELVGCKTGNRQANQAHFIYVTTIIFIKVVVDAAPTVGELVIYSQQQALAIYICQGTED